MADFRREYSLSWEQLNELDVAEFTSLIFGLSAQSRLVDELSKTATVEPMQEQPRTADEFAAHLSRHPGAVVEVIRRGK